MEACNGMSLSAMTSNNPLDYVRTFPSFRSRSHSLQSVRGSVIAHAHHGKSASSAQA